MCEGCDDNHDQLLCTKDLKQTLKLVNKEKTEKINKQNKKTM